MGGEESEDYGTDFGDDSYRDDFSQQKSETYGDDFSKEKSNEDETYGDDFVADEAPQEEPDEALAARGLKRCVAVHAFNADGETELSVTKGEALLVPIADLAEGADGWVYATAVEGGREGPCRTRTSGPSAGLSRPSPRRTRRKTMMVTRLRRRR